MSQIIPPGWAEFNDAQATIRGMMVCKEGTFSGTFAATNVDAVQGLNIRGGAVSSYYIFSTGANNFDVSFTLPPQEYARIADITAPFVHYNYNATSTVAVYKNGILIGSCAPTIVGDFCNMASIRFIDYDVSIYDPATYRLVGSVPSGSNSIEFLGQVLVGCRKR